MKERPILFSGLMVRAILEGRKTQTRRVVKGRSSAIHADWPLSGLSAFSDGNATFRKQNDVDSYTTESVSCPYGEPGDRLWVRETMHMDGDGVWLYSADDDFVGCDRDDESIMISWAHHKDNAHCPSIHMPRWASRITLEVIGVRVGRLQDISEADAIAEGVERNWLGEDPCPPEYQDEWMKYGSNDEDFPAFSVVESYASLWDTINAKRGYSWASNPWVWIVEFKMIQ